MIRGGLQAAIRALRAGGRGVLSVVLIVLLGLGAAVLWRGWHPDQPSAAPLPAHPFDLRVDARATSPATPTTGAPEPATPPAYGPDRLGIPSLGVDAPLVPEPATNRGDLVIPGEPGTVGRWRAGPDLAATTGTTLLAGHVSVAGVGLGALSELHRVAPGALVVTTDATGTPRYWRVDALLVRAKNDLPAFGADGPRRLAIVTCGGPIDVTASGHSYRDNVIAFAAPARPPESG